jgi:transcription-repair coupling factor (superfamily II helicase)
VDIVIGTHKLTSKEVKFKDLGLLIIDEEQKFGVAVKEKLRQFKVNVDTLTMTATPIPRTLQFSIMGARDLSIIQTPPPNRYPIHTEIHNFDAEVIKEAISFELSRNGQVFLITNRISGMEELAALIRRHVPGVRVCIGHGQMEPAELERRLYEFINHDHDVLIATSIVENGIDIPNANTIIILNADRFGLAQLYQLRGRVGRSSRLAYAYLMYQPNKVLTEIARKRLAAIREFTEFGAGFKLAMRDLELRGAGNMLGEAQSGHIESIGYELYCKEIDRAVRKLKGETVTEERSDITIDLPATQAAIPSVYIMDETLRLQAYKKIASITSQDDAEDLADELLDRYGDVPEETMNLLKVAEIRAHAEMLGVTTIQQRDKRVVFRFADVNRFNAYAAVMAKAEFGDSLTITSGKVTALNLFVGKTIDLNKVLGLMRLLRDAAEQVEAQNRQDMA